MADPGLLANRIWPRNESENSLGWILIPHYRDLIRLRRLSRKIPSLRVESPDQRPSDIARMIRQSEGVISSSLHGIIFAHSYGIPAVALRPPALEGKFKYLDYAASVNWRITFADSIDEALKMRKTEKAPDIHQVLREITFPSLRFLEEKQVKRPLSTLE